MVNAIISRSVLLLVALICIPNGIEAIRVTLNYDSQIGNPTIFGSTDDDICKSIVESQGYLCEQHQVTTEDGYILGLQRIPASRSGQKANKPPVLLQHGIFSDARTWMFNSPEESLAFILADNGYDVWLANARGTSPSRGHTSLSPDDPDFWEWSWDELAAYDLPANFQYVHDQTGQNLHYVAHSLGTLTAFGAFSQDKLTSITRSAAMLSPIAYLSLIPSLLTQAAAKLFLAEDVYWLGLHQFVPQGKGTSHLLAKICDIPGIDCSDLMNSVTGPNCCLNSSKEDFSSEPTATKNLIHLAQMIRDGTIKMYDYGNDDENTKHYGQTTPPNYDMTRIPNDLPLFLSYGKNDRLSDFDDVQILLDKLKDHESDKLEVQLIDNYAHLDFVRGVNANQVVYSPLIDFFELH